MISTCAQVSMLPIFKFLNIKMACKIILIHMHIFAPWYHVSLFNLFMQRIYILCNGSLFEISKFRFMVIRIFHFIVWLIIAISSSFITDPSPYNIYTSSVDHVNGYTCSLFVSSKVDIYPTIVIMIAGLTIFSANIFAWGLFMYKFAEIIKFTSNANQQNNGFQRIMMEQTLIVALAVSSTVIFYMIQMTGFLGQFFVTLDFVVTPIVIFLGFNCNRYYFELLKCDKLAISCCSSFENRILAKVSNRSDEKMAAVVVGNGSPTPSTPVPSPSRARIASSSSIQIQFAESRQTTPIPTPIPETETQNTSDHDHDSDQSQVNPTMNLEDHASSGLDVPSTMDNPSASGNVEMSTRL